MTSRVPVSLALLGGSALVLAGCATATPAAEDAGDGLRIVASTNVYGSLAAAVGGDDVEVTSIIDSLSQDPHSYEASARDQLTIADADLIVENGGGYDSFIDGLIDASGSEATVLTAVEFSHDYPDNAGHSDEEHAEEEHADDHAGHDHIEGFNEHVWYDPHTVVHLVEDIAHELGELDAADADTYEANAADLVAQIEGLEGSLGEIAAEHEGEQIFVTEPVPVYLAAAAGLVDATPAAFSEAVEEGQDVPPATLLEARDILASGDVRAVITNAQTGGAETTEIVSLAEDEGIPVIEFTELLPEGPDYVEWMQENIDALAGSLTE